MPDAPPRQPGRPARGGVVQAHRGQQDPGREALIHEAHEVLSNPKRRAAYDASLVTAQERADAAQQANRDAATSAATGLDGISMMLLMKVSIRRRQLRAGWLAIEWPAR